MRAIIFAFLILFAVPAAFAQDRDIYENARFGYSIDIPSGYRGEGESDNGEGQIFRPREGTQLLRVHGGNVLDDFEATVGGAIAFARDDGWALSYERVTPRWASFSGTRNGMIVYARAIALCDGEQYASFEIEYPERDIEDMHEVVERLVASLKATGTGASC